VARTAQRGFTLIELMIVVVLAAILIGIAIPSYRSYILRTNRTDATTALLKIAAAQERFYLQNDTYGSLADLNIDAATERGYYSLTVTGADTRGYQVTALVVGGGSQSDDLCNDFSIDETGQRLAKHSEISDAREATRKCWR
jgi:type IV pilus assembly protein PilE